MSSVCVCEGGARGDEAMVVEGNAPPASVTDSLKDFQRCGGGGEEENRMEREKNATTRWQRKSGDENAKIAVRLPVGRGEKSVCAREFE